VDIPFCDTEGCTARYRWRVLSVLVIAPTCDGEDVGEAWVAFQWVRRLAAEHRLTVLTYHKRGRTPAREQLPHVRFVEWTEPAVLGRAERLNSMLKPGYLPFLRNATRWIRGALARGERFDVGHQLSPVAIRYPSPLRTAGIPYLLGPLGGSLDSPEGFRAEEGSTPWYVGLRGIDRLRLRRDPWLRGTLEGARTVLGISGYVEELLCEQRVGLRGFETMADTGIESLPAPTDRSTRDPAGPVRLLYVGRVVRTKGVRDAVRAMTRLDDLPVVLDVVGDGFDAAECRGLVTAHGLADRVRMHGAVAHEEIDAFYRSADVFVFPSYREPGGTVVFEAMGHGLPLIVADRGGPAGSVDRSSGLRLSPRTPEQYAHDIADAVRLLVVDRSLRLSLGEGARRRAAAVGLWDSRVARIGQLYREAAG
jgi:glycosyltransferase involved in cell wall biosynthesis